ncbi:MAG: ATP12 family chaperone protein [Bosea sp. (in: a-proteobacteria)]
MSTDAFLDRFGAKAENQPNPMHSAQQSLKMSLPKRFYKQASVLADGGLFHVALDGRKAKTPARNALALPSQAAAEAMAAEWQAQVDVIDPAKMPLTRLTNSAIDGVATTIDAVRDEMRRYGASDAICYRADAPDNLVAQQNAVLDPVLDWSRDMLGAELKTATGITFIQQSDAALAAIAKAINVIPAPFALAATHSIMTLTGSIILALALQQGHLDADAVWDAAHLDETYQASVWGQDDEAILRQTNRRRDFDAAVTLLQAL